MPTPAQISERFAGRVDGAARLSSPEITALAGTHPDILSFWSTAVLGGNEQSQIQPLASLQGRMPAAALPLLGQPREFMGAVRLDYTRGALADKLQALYKKKNPDGRQRLETVCRTAGELVFTHVAQNAPDTQAYSDRLPVVPQTMVTIDRKTGRTQIGFPGQEAPQKYDVNGSVHSIATFGPGLTGAIFSSALMQGELRNISFISGGMGAHFVNHFIELGLQAAEMGIVQARQSRSGVSGLPSGYDVHAFSVPERNYYADGIAAAIGSMAARHEVLDISVMSSVYDAGVEDCVAGIQGSHELLRPGGLLVLKSPLESRPGEAGMDVIVPAAQAVFGDPVAAGFVNISHQIFDDIPVGRPTDFAIFRR
ncbi:MAG TPA: hypothetical protein VLF62_05640 [Candidatus Saccharimonadales bacterium]|nr:hypothetical protein [Candidatus Saccharimonadales bacterium]